MNVSVRSRSTGGNYLRCSLRERCLDPVAKGHRVRRLSVVRRLLPPPAFVERNPVVLGSMRWVDVTGRAHRLTCRTLPPFSLFVIKSTYCLITIVPFLLRALTIVDRRRSPI